MALAASEVGSSTQGPNLQPEGALPGRDCRAKSESLATWRRVLGVGASFAGDFQLP